MNRLALYFSNESPCVIRMTLCTYIMIRSFADKATQQLFEGGNPRKFRAFKAQAERKLQMLDAAMTLDFLRSPPGNRLESLAGGRKGQYSIRINQQFRICFRWEVNGPVDVEIVDYH